MKDDQDPAPVERSCSAPAFSSVVRAWPIDTGTPLPAAAPHDIDHQRFMRTARRYAGTYRAGCVDVAAMRTWFGTFVNAAAA